MKISLLVCLVLLIHNASPAQKNKADSIDKLIAKATSDTQKINLGVQKIRMLANSNLDTAILAGNQVIIQAKNIAYKKGEASARISVAGDYCFKGNYTAAQEYLDAANQILSEIKDSATLAKMYDIYGMMNSMQNKYDASHAYYEKGIAIAKAAKDNEALNSLFQNAAIAYQQQSNYPKAIEYYQKALIAAEKNHDEEGSAFICLNIGITYSSLDDKARAEQSYLKAINIAKKLNLTNVEAYAYANLATVYEDQHKYKEQYDAAMKAAILGKQTGDEGIEASSLSRAALALANQDKLKEAEALNTKAMSIADASKQPYNIYQSYADMGVILRMGKAYNKAIPYYEKAFKKLTDADLYDAEIGNSYFDLSECYEKTGDYKKALSTYKISAKIKDSIRGRENIKKATELTMNYAFEKKQQIQKDEQTKQNDVARERQTALLIGLIFTVILAAVALNGFKNKRNANFQLQQQKTQIESTLSELKTTQSQLIQSEKMASLGELTAGIAHEIQNPLNFVNNFSEMNIELANEINDENNIDELKAIANDIKQNSEKILFHGQRADAIVKGMLQHSRQSSGKKEPTDINALCDEYLRLSYHGLRAKDKSFNADLKTNFDESIGKINIVPQDIGRVLLNLFNNAFYAVKAPNPLKGEQWKPLVSVATRKIAPLQGMEATVEIIVSDNGHGIPQNILDKIFHPFFTTKPTGQGTGLGLSLAYDIITKEHKGTIKVESKEAVGTVFRILVPQ
ncbi:MAG: tetratricopeptide repeat protein [Parafilimonas sp.]|nr:tetratricopeptide repeat protein [Parafilimonas sp.]